MKPNIKALVAAISLGLTGLPAFSAPQQPGIVITVEGTNVTAFWNPVIGASGYTLYYAPFPSYSPIGSLDMNNSTDITVNLPVGSAFAVAVKAKDAGGESDYSNIESFTVNSPNPTDANASIDNIIASVGNHVIVPTYQDLALKTTKMVEALEQLKTSPTDNNLQAMRFAWRDARRAWEQTETFLFGPVDTQGLDPALDSWPVNRADLDAVLNSGRALDLAFVTALDDTLHGFHTIEYLIFGANNNKSASMFTAREMEYLVSTTQLLHTHAQALFDAWQSSGKNFVAEFNNAGKGSTVYPSQSAALQELANGMTAIVDEVANGKIADPFSQSNVELVESQFSFNSLLDFENNIRGVENVYLGRYLQVDGPGLNDLVRRNNPALDTKIRAGLDASINAIQAIPFPFRNAILNSTGRAVIEQAQQKLNELKVILESELLPNITAYK